jgi:hypothetical protein
MRVLLLIAVVLGLVVGGILNAQERGPSTSPETIRLLKNGHFTGDFGADIEFMTKGSGYCFFRYEYTFGQSDRMLPG